MAWRRKQSRRPVVWAKARRGGKPPLVIQTGSASAGDKNGDGNFTHGHPASGDAVRVSEQPGPRKQKEAESGPAIPGQQPENMSPVSVRATGKPTTRIHRREHFREDVVLIEKDSSFPDPGRTWNDYEQVLAEKYQAEPLADWRNEHDPLHQRNWPHTSCITRSPFHFDGEKRPSKSILFKKERKEFLSKEAALTRVIDIPELADNIFRYLTYPELLSLGMTRSVNYAIIGNYFDCWDVTTANYHFCDIPDDDIQSALNENKMTTEDVKRRGCGGRVMVTSSRRRPTPGPVETFRGVIRLLGAVNNMHDKIRVLHLHRVDYLTTDLLSIILGKDNLPQMKELGIYNCPLLHFACTSRILSILYSRKERGMHIEHFDMFPRYHQGPNDINREGSFGVTWNDSGIDTDAAIFSALFQHIIPKCNKLGINLMAPGMSFRNWLEKIPLVDWALPRMFSLLASVDIEREFYSMNTGGRWKPIAKGIFAIMTHDAPTSRHHVNTKMFHCPACRSAFSQMWRHGVQLGHWASPRTCVGCSLELVLEKEADHYKVHKRTVSEALTARTHEHRPQLEDFVAALTKGPRTKNQKWATRCLYKAYLLVQALEEQIRLDLSGNKDDSEAHTRRTEGKFRKPWPALGPGDWLSRCPQTEHPCKPPPPRASGTPQTHWQYQQVPPSVQTSGLRVMRAEYCPAGDWDTKHLRYKPDPSVNSVRKLDLELSRDYFRTYVD